MSSRHEAAMAAAYVQLYFAQYASRTVTQVKLPDKDCDAMLATARAIADSFEAAYKRTLPPLSPAERMRRKGGTPAI